MLVMSLIQITGLITGSAGLVRAGTLGWVLLAYPVAPSIVYALFLSRGWKGGGTVPGAADNLSACALAVAMCRFLVKNPSYIPDDTEIRFVSFGSEEAGCRGSRRYVARHLDELRRLDVRQLNYETIAHPETIILTSETNGTVKDSPEMVDGVVAAAQRAGVPYKVQPATLGAGSDAGPFSRAGLKGHDAARLRDATDGGLLSSEVGHAGGLDHRAAVERAEAHLRVGAQWRGVTLPAWHFGSARQASATPMIDRRMYDV